MRAPSSRSIGTQGPKAETARKRRRPFFVQIAVGTVSPQGSLRTIRPPPALRKVCRVPGRGGLKHLRGHGNLPGNLVTGNGAEVGVQSWQSPVEAKTLFGLFLWMVQANSFSPKDHNSRVFRVWLFVPGYLISTPRMSCRIHLHHVFQAGQVPDTVRERPGTEESERM